MDNIMGNKNLFVNVLGKYLCVISILFFFIIEKEEKDCYLYRLMSCKCVFLLICIIRMFKILLYCMFVNVEIMDLFR